MTQKVALLDSKINLEASKKVAEHPFWKQSQFQKETVENAVRVWQWCVLAHNLWIANYDYREWKESLNDRHLKKWLEAMDNEEWKRVQSVLSDVLHDLWIKEQYDAPQLLKQEQWSIVFKVGALKKEKECITGDKVSAKKRHLW